MATLVRATADAFEAGYPDASISVEARTSREAMAALFAEPEYVRLIQPDEQYLSDPAAVRWIVCESPNRVIG